MEISLPREGGRASVVPGENILRLLVEGFLGLHPLDVRSRGGTKLVLEQVLRNPEGIRGAWVGREGGREGGREAKEKIALKHA